MFKLIKINNGRMNVPEMVNAPMDSTSEFKAHCLYYVSCGTLSTSKSEENDPPFIPIESVPIDSPQAYIRGYFVTEDMVFETTVEGQPVAGLVGTVLEGHYGDSGGIESLEPTPGTTALVLSDFSLFEDGKVTVALKW